MSSTSPQILVICPEADQAEIAAILADGGYEGSVYADGDEGTIERFLELDPDVVVVYASLERGDARALTTELRARGRVAKLVLIGDTDGPVRNALDAADFAVDRFLARPLAAKALLFAVRTCLDAAQRARQKAAAAPKSQLSRKMASAMDQAIDDFVRTAMDALPGQASSQNPGRSAGAPGQTHSSTHSPPVPFSPAITGPNVMKSAPGASEPPTLILPADISPAPYPPASTGPIPMITPKMASERAAERRARRSRTPKRLSNTMVAVPPPPTGEGESEGESGASQSAEPVVASEDSERKPPSADIPAPDASDADRPPQRGQGGAFGRQLRRKMSDMAARLFPTKEGTPAVDVDIARTHSSEIDLSSFGVDTVVEAPKKDAGALDQLRSTSSVPRSGASDDESEVSSLDFGATIETRVEPTHDSEDSDASALAEDRPDSGGEAASAVSGASVVADSAPAVADGADSDSDFGQRGHTVVTAASDDIDTAGSLRRGEADAALLIERMYRQRFNGRVRFVNYNATKEIFFDKGRPVFAASDQAHDRMGEQLFREGKITSVQLAKVRQIVAKTGRRMGEVLIEKGWLKRRELLPVVRKHIEDLVYSLFAWEDGSYQILEGDFAASERIRISRHPAAMILEGVRRKYELESLQALLGAPESVIEIVDDRNLKSVMSVADLNSTERKVMTSFDGERSLTDVHEMSTLELTEVYQLAYGLVVWGAAQSMRRGEDGPAAASDEPALFGETDLAIDRQRVAAKYSLVMEADYFALLGVRRDATSFEVKRAYEAARRDFTSDGFPAEIRTELGGHIGEINEVLEEAYLILRDDGLRISYLVNLRD